MERSTIIKKLSKYFATHELVGKATYEFFEARNEDSWQVFDTDTLHCLLIMREGIGLPFSVNNWFWGGTYDERGFRSNIQYIVRSKTNKGIIYLSGHPLGKAIDFQVDGMGAEDVRNWIEDHAKEFPCKIRLEWKKKNKEGVYKPITWVHYDTKQIDSKPKIYKFNI